MLCSGHKLGISLIPVPELTPRIGSTHLHPQQSRFKGNAMCCLVSLINHFLSVPCFEGS